MDSDNFFGFDTTHPVEDNDEDEEVDDDEYDALNDETFGSAAVGGDWEENHKQLSSLTDAERLRMSAGKDVTGFNARRNDINFQLEQLHNKESFRTTLESVPLASSYERKRLYERSINSSPLIDLHKDDVSSSPGSSIWSPTLGLDQVKNLSQLNKPVISSCSVSNNAFSMQSLLSEPQHFNKQMDVQALQDLNLGLKLRSSVKTVSELEEELKRQHVANRQNISSYTDDIERELARQLNIQKPNCFPTSSSYLAVRGPSNAATIQSTMSHPFMNSHENYPNIHSQLHHTSGNLKSLNNQNFQNPLQYTHPLLNNLPNKMLPPGFVNNASNIFNRHPLNLQLNQRPTLIRGGVVFQLGGNSGGGRNIINRSNNIGRKNFDQNCVFEQQRNNLDHQREKNNSLGGNRVRRDSDAEWEEWQRIRQADEYAGLMTPREKGWLRNIQAMQLQASNPYQDDYYFVMCNAKQQRKREEEVFVLDDLQLLLHDDKGKEGKEYEPPRLENSLGKLQVASVNAPRKIIDLQVVHLDSSHPTTTLQRDMRKHRHLLLHVEKLYNIQIELDDLERKIRALPDCPTRDLFRSKCRQLVNKLWSDLINPHESFVQLLCIRKGKTLVARMLNWVGTAEIEHLLATVTQNLSLITKKDINDKRLALFWPYADRFFNACSSSTLVSFGIMMEPQFQDKRWNFPALSSKLGLSMILSLLVCGEKYSSELEKDNVWQQFLKKAAISLAYGEDKCKDIMPLPSIILSTSARLPASHLSRCSGLEPAIMKRALEFLRSCEEYLTKNLCSNLPSSSPSLKSEQKTPAEHAQPDSGFLICNLDSIKTSKPTIEIF